MINRKNITRLAFVIVILSFMLSTFVSLWSLRIMAEQNLQELSKSLASRIYDSISSELTEPITVSKSMANDSLLLQVIEQEQAAGTEKTEEILAEYLSALRRAFHYEAAFVVSDATMNYYSYGGINKQIDLERNDRDQWYARFIETEKEYELDVDHDELRQDEWTVFVDTRIEDHAGKLLGVCGVGAQLTGNHDLFVRLENEYGVRIFMIDSDGVVQISKDEDLINSEYMDDLHLSQSSDYVYQKLGPKRYAVTKYIEKLDWYLVIESDGNVGREQLINMLILNVVLCIVVLVIMLLAIRIIIARTRALTAASFVDQTTKLYNRRAFEERKAELSLSQLNSDFVFVTADLNGLKQANDGLGHAAGDELIKGAADCLKTAFGSYGDIYRIGGDEFAAMLHCSREQLENAMRTLEEVSKSWKGQKLEGVSLSVGFASSREFPSENIAELLRISDERMYAAKDEYYQKTGKKRRS